MLASRQDFSLGARARSGFSPEFAELRAGLCFSIRSPTAPDLAEAADHGAVYDKSVALQDDDTALVPSLQEKHSLFVSILVAAAGLALGLVGANLVVGGSISLARGLGIPETLTALTIVALGKSMPELVTSVVASLKRQGDIAFGNIVGSNTYNTFGNGDATALMAPGPVPMEIVCFDNLVMIGVSIALVVFAGTGLRINRWEGAALLAGYGAYFYLVWP